MDNCIYVYIHFHMKTAHTEIFFLSEFHYACMCHSKSHSELCVLFVTYVNEISLNVDQEAVIRWLFNSMVSVLINDFLESWYVCVILFHYYLLPTTGGCTHKGQYV